MMKLIDTHAHIYLEEFKDGLQTLIERAVKEGVVSILMPAIDSETHSVLMDLSVEYPRVCVPMMGLHPCSVKENYKEELGVAKEYFDDKSFIAVGETGLDFYWDLTFKKEQYDAFNQQIEWALQYNIPVVIHSRNSTDECIEVISQHQNGNLKGVFHCFSGNLVQAKKIADLGFYLGIGGVVTFKNSGLDSVLKEVSLENLVLETDAPYLSPVPFRGKRNEPSYLKYVLEKISAVKMMTIEEVAAITTINAEKLFQLRKWRNNFF
jgi:TatD DNase family protein